MERDEFRPAAQLLKEQGYLDGEQLATYAVPSCSNAPRQRCPRLADSCRCRCGNYIVLDAELVKTSRRSAARRTHCQKRSFEPP